MVNIRNHNLVLHSDFTHKLHPRVTYELGKIGVDDQMKFMNNYNLRKRSLKLAFVCLLFFPGTHYAFLGKWQLQILFWLTLGGGLVWWLVDFFRLKQIVKHSNHNIQREIVRDLHSVNIFYDIKPPERAILKTPVPATS